jgi:Flp pilus assembly protein TadD
VAVLPFDNLTGDPSLDWISSAAQRIVAEQLTGAAGVFPMLAGTVEDAYAARAARFVHGYFERRHGSLHIEVAIEDSSRHKMVRTAAVDGALLPSLTAIAKSIDPTARSFSSSNEEAVAAWAKGDFERAVSLDPDFGGAWISWVQVQIGMRNLQQAADTAQKALARPTLRSPFERAQLMLLSATARRDEPAREQAMLALTKLVQNDPVLFSGIAETEMNARHFAQAARMYQEAVRVDPHDAADWNMLGYAQTYAGDLAAARKSFERYGKEPGQEANALDSEGEALFLHGQFREAEKYFLESQKKDSAQSGGAELLKAAYARWLSGDLSGADTLFGQYAAFRAKSGDPLIMWRQAVWEYATGRQARAVTRLEGVTGPAAELARAQLDMWRDPSKIPHDLPTLKQLYDRTPAAKDGPIRTFYAAALLEAGKRDEARNLAALWPLPGTSDNALLEAFLYPKFLEVRRKLQQGNQQ